MPYTPVNSAAVITGNQYAVDYSANTIKVSPEAVTLIQNASASIPNSNKITVVYDYQANMTLTNPSPDDADSRDLAPITLTCRCRSRWIIRRAT